MLERIWTNLLEILANFVTPDWGALVLLLPVGLFIFIVIVLFRTFRSLRKAPPARRGMARIPPKTPAGIHMPGPSFSPIFAAIGVFLLFLGLVFGGTVLILGGIALALTLLYWLAEGLRIYDHDLGTTVPELPAVVHDGPPRGVHMPGPSWRPFLGALGVFLLFLGLVFPGPLLAVGVLALIVTLLGWLTDARKEYVNTVAADKTGHLENIPTQATPRRLLTVLGVLVVGAAIIQSGVFSTGEANGGTGAPAASGSTEGAGPPPASGPAADVTVEAKGVAFIPTTWTGPADKAFTLAFDNEDTGTPHNIELTDKAGAVVFKGAIFNGVETRAYDVPALKAGDYVFSCIVHPSMTGTATLK